MALDSSKNMWLLSIKKNGELYELLYPKKINSPYTFENKVYFAHRLVEESSGERVTSTSAYKCHDIYFCTSTTINGYGTYIY